jgi:hypothetical protein
VRPTGGASGPRISPRAGVAFLFTLPLTEGGAPPTVDRTDG